MWAWVCVCIPASPLPRPSSRLTSASGWAPSPAFTPRRCSGQGLWSPRDLGLHTDFVTFCQLLILVCKTETLGVNSG